MGNCDDNLYDFTCLYWIDISISNRFVNGIYLMEYIILSILFGCSLLYVFNHIMKTVKNPENIKCSQCDLLKK